MNKFLQAAISAINRHGADCTYKTIQTSSYNPATGSSTTSSTDYVVKTYQKQIIANQYNYPNLVGKESAMFYIANNSLGFTPKPNDKIVQAGKTFTVVSVQEHRAESVIVLYRIIAVKG